MKKIFIILLIISMIFCNMGNLTVVSAKENNNIWTGGVSDSYAGGDGTSKNPYQISTPEELAYFKENINNGDNYKGKHFILTTDIYMNDVSDFDSWDASNSPDNKWEGINNFAGTFDGNYHTIYGIYNVGKDNVGFFNIMDSKVKVEINNLNFDKCYIYGHDNVALIVGKADNIYIDNCTVNGVVNGSNDYIAGFVGRSGSGGNMGTSITNSKNYANISGFSKIGGFIGYSTIGNSSGYDTSGNGNEKIVLMKCINKGSISGHDSAGGIAGGISRSLNCGGVDLKYLVNEGDITIKSEYAGGIFGSLNAQYDKVSVEECFNKGKIEATDDYYSNNYLGGIIGATYSSFTTINVNNSYNIGEVYGKNSLGGIIGRFFAYTSGGTTISYCHNVGKIYSKENNSYAFLGSYQNLGWTDGSYRTSNSYYLYGTADNSTYGSKTNVSSLDAEKYLDTKSFNSWDFDKTWIMGNSYPILRWINDYTMEVPDYDKHGDKTIDDYMIEEVKKYTSDDVYAQFDAITNSDTTYEEKYRRYIALFSKNYGITDVKEGIHYLSSTTSYRYSYLNLITDDIYCANNFNNYINNNIIAKTALYTDGLIFNYELSSYLDIGTYIKNETPGIKKCKTMLKEFLEANKKYSSNQVFNNANLTAKYLKNIIKLNNITAEEDMKEVMDQILNCKSETKLKELQTYFVNNYIMPGLNESDKKTVYLDGDQFGKALGYSSKILSFTGATASDILDIITLEEQISIYQQYSNFLDTIAKSTDISLDMRIAAAQLLEDIENGYFNEIRSILGNVITLGIDFMYMDKSMLETFLSNCGLGSGAVLTDALATLNLATFISNIVVDTGDFVRQAAYTRSYAELANLYSKILQKDKKKFNSDASSENAWKFFEDYSILWSLRYNGEQQYLDMNKIKMYLFASIKTFDYDLKEEVVNDNLSQLEKIKFKVSSEVEVPDSVQYMKKAVIQCPVDVDVYTKDGILIATLKDGQESDIVNSYGRFIVVHDNYSGEYIKVICLNKDDDVLYKLTAISDGLVDYSYSNKIATNTFDKLEVSKGNTIIIDGNEYTIDYDNDGTVDLKGSLVIKDNNNYIPIENAEIETQNAEIVVGTTKTINIKILPDTATNTNVDWFSNDESIATVKNGVITGISEGKTSVFAKVIDSNICFEIKVNVKAKSIESVEVTAPSRIEYTEGQKLDLTDGKITVKYDNGTSEDVAMTDKMISGYDKDKTGKQTVTVSYEGFTKEFEVNVKAKSIESVEVTAPSRIEYTEGQKLDLTDGKITVKYDNGTSEDVAITDKMISGYDKDKTGKQTVTVSYEGFTKEFEVNVKAKSIESVEVTAPSRIEYTEGQKLDLTDGKITVKYDNGTSEDVAITDKMISGYDKDKTGKQTVTVSYEGFTKEFEVNVIKKTILNVELSSLPNKVNYVVNQEFDVSGASLKVIYNNNEVNYVDVTSEMFINPDMSNIGSQEIKLSYEGFELKFSILVKDKVLIDMKLDTSPNVLTYIEGDTLDTNGGKILLVYDNGTEEIVDLEAVMCSVDMNNIGKQTVTIKFNDFKASYDIIINKKQLEYINWITEPSKSIYIEGEEIDYSGKVLLTYNNGIKQEVEVTKDLFMIKNYDSKDIGKQTIYFVYKDTNIKIPYNIEVISKKPIKLEIKQLPYKIDYLKDEAFEIQGLEVIVTYNDETTELISLDDLNVSHINMKKVGKQIITLTYGGVETTFEIKISEKRVEDIKTDNSDDTNLSTDDIPTKEKDRTVSNDTVKTNDNEPFDVYLFVMFTSLFGIILTLKKKIHRKNRIRN